MPQNRTSGKSSDLDNGNIIWRHKLPSTKNTIFTDSAFFRDNGKNAKLPSPQAVRERAVQLDTGESRRIKPHCVPFASQRLIVKYGQHVKIAQGLVLWAIRHQLRGRVPVPEVYGWCQDKGEVFIYVEYIEGPTLEDVMDNLHRRDLLHITGQLREIVLALRSLRQAPGEHCLG